MTSRDKKEKAIKELASIVDDGNSIVFTDFAGLSTNELNELKSNLRESGARYKVTKKSLWPFIVKESGIKEGPDFLNHRGSVGVAYSSDEGVSTAKAVVKFSKDHKQLSVLGGFVENLFVGKEKVLALSALASREELLSKFVFVISDPMRQFMGVLGGAQRDFVSVLNKIKESKE